MILNKQRIAALVTAALLPFGAHAATNCKAYGLDIKVVEDKNEVHIDITHPFEESEEIFRLSSSGPIQGPHEKVSLVFAKPDCTELKGNLITCGGVPLTTSVIPYWHFTDEIFLAMDRVHIQTREVQALRYGDGKPYEFVQVYLGGNVKGLSGGTATLDIDKYCSK